MLRIHKPALITALASSKSPPTQASQKPCDTSALQFLDGMSNDQPAPASNTQTRLIKTTLGGATTGVTRSAACELLSPKPKRRRTKSPLVQVMSTIDEEPSPASEATEGDNSDPAYDADVSSDSDDAPTLATLRDNEATESLFASYWRPSNTHSIRPRKYHNPAPSTRDLALCDSAREDLYDEKQQARYLFRSRERTLARAYNNLFDFQALPYFKPIRIRHWDQVAKHFRHELFVVNWQRSFWKREIEAEDLCAHLDWHGHGAIPQVEIKEEEVVETVTPPRWGLEEQTDDEVTEIGQDAHSDEGGAPVPDLDIDDAYDYITIEQEPEQEPDPALAAWQEAQNASEAALLDIEEDGAFQDDWAEEYEEIDLDDSASSESSPSDSSLSDSSSSDDHDCTFARAYSGGSLSGLDEHGEEQASSATTLESILEADYAYDLAHMDDFPTPPSTPTATVSTASASSPQPRNTPSALLDNTDSPPPSSPTSPKLHPQSPPLTPSQRATLSTCQSTLEAVTADTDTFIDALQARINYRRRTHRNRALLEQLPFQAHKERRMEVREAVGLRVRLAEKEGERGLDLRRGTWEAWCERQGAHGCGHFCF